MRKKTKTGIRHLISGICIFAVICHLSSVICVQGDFEDLGCGARPMGMGNAFVGLADDVNAIYFNPAGLGEIIPFEFASSHARLWTGLNGPNETDLGNTFISCVCPLKIYHHSPRLLKDWGTVGVGWTNLSLTDYYWENSVILGYGKKVNRLPLSVGANLKILHKKYGKDDYTENDKLFQDNGYSKLGFSCDLGALYSFKSKYRLGLMLTNLNQPKMDLAAADRLGRGAKFGFAYRNRDFALAADLLYQRGDFKLHSGGEKWFLSNLIGVRGGLGIGSRQYRNLSLGASLRIDRFQLDYAFLYPLAGVRNTYGSHRLALNLRFALLEGQRPTRLTHPLSPKEKVALRNYYKKALDYYQREEYKKAVKACQKALTINPTYREAKKLLQKAKEMSKLTPEQRGELKALETQRVLQEWWGQGMQLYQAGEYEKAIAEFEKLLRVKPEHSQSVRIIRKCKEALAKRPREYVVQEGDTLWSISREVYGDPKLWRKIQEANEDKIEEGEVKAGQVLVIPPKE